MGSQVGLSLRRVFYHKVHDGVSLQGHSENMRSRVVTAGKEGGLTLCSTLFGLTFV